MGEILTPFLIAALLAYLGDPLVNKLEKWHFSRTFAAAFIFSVMLLLLIGLGLLIVPLLQNQIQILIDKIPDMIYWVQQTVMPWLSEHFDIKMNINPVEIKKILMAHWQQAGSVLDTVLTTVTHSTHTVLKVLINFVLIPVVTFYLLRDWPLLLKHLNNLVPRQYLAPVVNILSQCDEVLGAFFRGQFLVMFLLGLYYILALSVMHLDLAVLIGLIIAILSIVPFLGSIIGLLLGLITTVFQFHDLRHVVYLLIIFGVGHVLENMILTPLLVGDRVGLHPVAVIFAVLLAGTFFGFFGVLLAIPLAAVILVVLKVLYQKYLQTPFYQQPR